MGPLESLVAANVAVAKVWQRAEVWVAVQLDRRHNADCKGINAFTVLGRSDTSERFGTQMRMLGEPRMTALSIQCRVACIPGVALGSVIGA